MASHLVSALIAAVFLSSCGAPSPEGSGPSPGPARGTPSASLSPVPEEPEVASPADLRRTELRLEPFVFLARAIAMVQVPDDPSRMLVAQRTGEIRLILDGQRTREPLLDLSADVSTDEERGLLGMALANDGSHIYVSYTDLGGAVRVVEYGYEEGAVVRGSRRELLRVPQPSGRHNGGHLVIDAEGNLWVGLGDGGLSEDPEDQAQSLRSLYGSILRIDPERRSGGRAYGIPPDNPFARRKGARAEIYAFGLRNPWRFSIDPATGDLWIGDVGESRTEEIDLLLGGEPAGANLGWNRLEGSALVRGQRPKGAIPPLHEYPHEHGACAVIGGHVYRGSAIPSLRGVYLYSDLCQGSIRGLIQRAGRVRAERDFGVGEVAIVSFAEDLSGELYVLSLERGVFKLVAG